MKKFAVCLGTLIIVIVMFGCADNYKHHYDLGKWYSEKGLINEAILEFKAATQANPNHHQAHHNLAIAYTKKGWYEYALKEAEIAFDLYPCDETYKLIQVIRAKKSLEFIQEIIDKESSE